MFESKTPLFTHAGKTNLLSCCGYPTFSPRLYTKHNIVIKQCYYGVSILTSLVWESAHIVPPLINFAMQLSIAAFHSFKSVSVSAANMYVRWAVYESEHTMINNNIITLIHMFCDIYNATQLSSPSNHTLVTTPYQSAMNIKYCSNWTITLVGPNCDFQK